ncbi:MAG: hypothetical protein Q9M19_06060 [Mariprofundaceae bacterium]|nr:hypothetical protein [Mariprofundaceae bacterium]
MQIKLHFLVLLLLVSGCGLKTGLVVYDDSAPLPSISQLSYQQDDAKITFSLDIKGGSGAVLYQIDRAEIEADCKCVGDWLRYYESSSSEQRLVLQRHIKLRTKQNYAFRLRVVDSLGRKSAWSKVIKTKGKITHE